MPGCLSQEASGTCANTVTGWLIHWGDGASDLYTSSGVKTHVYADGTNVYAITIDLTDEDGTFLNRANALSVQVNNVAPTVTLAGASLVDEAGTVMYSYTVTDPGAETFSRVSQSCGTLGVDLNVDTFNAVDGSGSFKCRFADDTPSNTPSDPSTASVVISDGGTGTGSVTTTVRNVAPTLLGVLYSYNPVTHVASASANYADIGLLDTHTVTLCGRSRVAAGRRRGAWLRRAGQ